MPDLTDHHIRSSGTTYAPYALSSATAVSLTTTAITDEDHNRTETYRALAAAAALLGIDPQRMKYLCRKLKI